MNLQKEYEEWKKKLLNNNKNGKGKLLPYKDLISQMVKDGIKREDMIDFFSKKLNIEVSIAGLGKFIRGNILHAESNRARKEKTISNSTPIDELKKEEKKEIKSTVPTRQIPGEIKQADLTKFNN